MLLLACTAPARADEVTSLDVCADGERIHLLIARRAADASPILQYWRSNDCGETWLPPVLVGTGQQPPVPAHRGMDAQLAAAGEKLVAVWTTEGKQDRFGRGPMTSAYSADGGKTWTAGPNPSDDGKASGHAFIDIVATADGSFHLVWLDGRAKSPATPPAGKGLRYAVSKDGGASWSANSTIDAETCECCWNFIAASPAGKLFVLYRDRDPRDMSIADSADGGRTWSTPATVGKFNWDINGCPHVGGALAKSWTEPASPLHAIVWTARDEAVKGVYVMNSIDEGRSWTKPTRLGNADAWHPDIACNVNEVHAVWDAHSDNTTSIFTARSPDAGRTWSSPIQLSGVGTSATHPRILSTPRGFRAFWTQRGRGKDVQWVMQSLP
jgi:hypothetical protein